MKLPVFDLLAGVWTGAVKPYVHTLFAAMFPHVKAAIIHADPDVEPETLVAGLPQGYALDFATGSKKHGDFVMTTEPVAEKFWRTAEEAVAYGSTLLTPCYGVPPVRLKLEVLVVQDGEYETGDCHAKASTGLWGELKGDVRRAAQFRLGAPGLIAKGTMAVQEELDEQGIDLVLPLSAFKCSNKPALGRHTWDAYLGVVAWSEARPTKMGWQVLQWFSQEAVEKDLLSRLEVVAAQLLEAMTDNRRLAKLLKLDAAEYEVPLLDLVLADRNGLLSQHPYIVQGLARMLRRKWLDLAEGAGMKWTGLMGLPNDALPNNTIATNDVPVGPVLVTRYPLRSQADLQLWHNVGGASDVHGVVWMNHTTAGKVAGDFDGDYFQVTPAEEYPHLAETVKAFSNNLEIIKVKERKQSPLTQMELAQVMLENANSQVGLIATMIARAHVHGYGHLIPKLAQELQISVDKFKYNLDHDYEFLEECNKVLPPVAWLKDHKKECVYRTRPMQVAQGEGTVGFLVETVNRFWKPRDVLARPLLEFKSLLPQATDERVKELATKLAINYGRALHRIGSLEEEQQERERSRLFESLRDWAAKVENPREWACALWHTVHTKSDASTGSLAFHAFPAEILKALETAEVPEQDKVAIVGLQFNAYKDTYTQFAGQVHEVKFAMRPLKGRMRMAALVGENVLGFVSSETPVQQGRRKVALTHSDNGRGLVVYATPVM
jgi:hypothetical protein